MDAGRELDAQLHAALFAVPVEWRLCATEPDCGTWQEIESFENYEDLAHGQSAWGHPAERQPCWTPAETDRTYRWEVVPLYSTDISAAWQIVEKLRLAVLCHGSMGWQVDTRTNTQLPYVEVYADTAPLAICRAALATTEQGT